MLNLLSRPEIERANLDGSGRTSIVSDDLVFPNGLALDYELNRLYWCDAGTDRIEYCDFDGRYNNNIIIYVPVYYYYIHTYKTRGNYRQDG